MSELAKALTADSYAAPPAHILEGLPSDLAHRFVSGAPHTIYQELWHLAFWQQVTLDWVAGVETPFPAHPGDGFPNEAHAKAGPDAEADAKTETWDQLRRRFLATADQAAAAACNTARLDVPIQCPSRPGEPPRTMSVRDQLLSLAAHNAYHLGRIVLLRQLLGVWPPPSGGYTW